MRQHDKNTPMLLELFNLTRGAVGQQSESHHDRVGPSESLDSLDCIPSSSLSEHSVRVFLVLSRTGVLLWY